MPVLHLLAGPNGAGKSNYVHDVLGPTTNLPFINADEIAEGSSFLSETVFTHPSKIDLVADAVDAGHLVHLHVIIVPVDLTVQRVLERVRRGGPECRRAASRFPGKRLCLIPLVWSLGDSNS